MSFRYSKFLENMYSVRCTYTSILFVMNEFAISICDKIQIQKPYYFDLWVMAEFLASSIWIASIAILKVSHAPYNHIGTVEFNYFVDQLRYNMANHFESKTSRLRLFLFVSHSQLVSNVCSVGRSIDRFAVLKLHWCNLYATISIFRLWILHGFFLAVGFSSNAQHNDTKWLWNLHISIFWKDSKSIQSETSF